MDTNKEREITVAILSVSLLTVMAGAIVAPAMSILSHFFSEQSASMIKLIVTLPALLVIPTAMVTGRLADRFGRRNLLLVGLVLYLVGGLGGIFAGDFYSLLGFRAILGLSVGLVMPISTGLVSEFFHGEKARQMMGWISAANHFGGMAAQIISGTLAVMSWRCSFGVYGIALISLIVVAFWLPEPTSHAQEGRATPLPLKTYFNAAFMLLLMVIFYTVPLNISLFVEGTGMGNSTTSGIACALVTGAPFLVGIFFRSITTRLGKSAVFVAICTMGLGMFTIGEANTLTTVFTGAFLVGTGEGYLFPYVMNAVRATVAPKDSVRALAVMSSMLYFGQFMSPIAIDALGGLFDTSASSQPFMIAGALCMVGATISLGFTIQQRIKRKCEKAA